MSPDAYKHKSTITMYLENFKEDLCIGVITRDYQEKRMKQSILDKEQEVEGIVVIKDNTFHISKFDLKENDGEIFVCDLEVRC